MVKAAMCFTAVPVSIFCFRCTCATGSVIGSVWCALLQKKVSKPDQRPSRTIAIKSSVREQNNWTIVSPIAVCLGRLKYRSPYKGIGNTIVQLRGQVCSGLIGSVQRRTPCHLQAHPSKPQRRAQPRNPRRFA
jgi:hypothetical protein